MQVLENCNTDILTADERKQLPGLYRRLLHATASVAAPDDAARLRHLISRLVSETEIKRTPFGFHPIIRNLTTAISLCEHISPDRNMIVALLLFTLRQQTDGFNADIATDWGEDVANLVEGLIKVTGLYGHGAAVASDNFRNLLLTFARDIRVIIIMIVDRFELMKAINHHPNDRMVQEMAFEALYLYAPLAHRLGLYVIKGQLEDLSLKYTNRSTFTDIARKLKETKKVRDEYIASFIDPLKRQLEHTGLKFEIKGRTKSIYSIWNKIKKQHHDIDEIYDLFAIRIIIDTPPQKEKSDCWLAYSVVTEMYQPNPSRLKDWLSIPKSNGYESLHITVKGPQNRWVEVQIRTRRMDLIAEKGLAAHWKYKGGKAEAGLDNWMNNIRDILESGESGPMELMKNISMDLYDKEVFVFTPKGDLYKLPMGATVLDFAFNIHSGLGCRCTGGKVNGKVCKLNYRLTSGDTVEILTAPNQAPKQDWLNFVVTGKARSKIRQTLNEAANRNAELAKELLQRRFKNRKLELDEPTLMRTIKKLGYKTVTEFYSAIAAEKLDVDDVISEYDATVRKAETAAEARSAGEFILDAKAVDESNDGRSSSDILIIGGKNLKGINYKLAKCCNPIYGDQVTGFISSEGVVKVHRSDCQNALHLAERYPYRIITTRWAGEGSDVQFGATLRVIGHDDIGIVTNITSMISKEKGVLLRNISIDAHDGIFQGYLVVGINDTRTLNNLIKKIKTVKGVKDVQRNN